MISFEESISTPENWFRQSWEMYETSKVLYSSLTSKEPIQSEIDLYRKSGSLKGAMLLLGLAIENALKGAFVYISKPDISNDKMNTKHFQDSGSPHDLIKISEQLGYQISNDQRDLLERLTFYVQWAAKYQAPLKKSEHTNAMGKLKLYYPSDYDLAKELINNLQINSGFHKVHGWVSR